MFGSTLTLTNELTCMKLRESFQETDTPTHVFMVKPWVSCSKRPGYMKPVTLP
jgi:hypothetical protein